MNEGPGLRPQEATSLALVQAPLFQAHTCTIYPGNKRKTLKIAGKKKTPALKRTTKPRNVTNPPAPAVVPWPSGKTLSCSAHSSWEVATTPVGKALPSGGVILSAPYDTIQPVYGSGPSPLSGRRKLLRPHQPKHHVWRESLR